MTSLEHVNGVPESLFASQNFWTLKGLLAAPAQRTLAPPKDYFSLQMLEESLPKTEPLVSVIFALQAAANREAAAHKLKYQAYNCPLGDSVCYDMEDYICHLKAHIDYEDSDLPMGRYISSGSEDESAAISDIFEPSLTYQSPTPPLKGNFIKWRDNEDDAMSARAASSITAASSSASDTKRKQSLRYQKRRDFQNPKVAKKQAPRRGIFQCTFCMADFVNVGNLTRHEREVHLAVERFVCEPYSMENVRGKGCPYCGKPFDLVYDPSKGEYLINTDANAVMRRDCAPENP
ncbi:hypothetical protein BDD12DRAFT_907066 [Trichophaea hybrida]|nr:hypothetical protein BDD12DRAFT_907066 [Trichophaea hybrida]